MIQNIWHRYSIWNGRRNDISNIKGKLQQCEAKPLSKGQKTDIISYFERQTGKRVPVYWHEYFFSRNGNFDVKYIPTCLYHSDIVYRLNNYKLRHAYVDKGVYDVFFPDINRPKTIVKNINGYFYDGEKSITPSEAYERCKNIPSAVIKPTQEGMWGEGVLVFSSKEGFLEEGKHMSDLLNSYGKNYIIQEKVEQSEVMNRLNPTSLNTLRVLSYRHNQEVHILYVVVRIGRKGKNVDNETAGGINADIDLQTGKIVDCAYGMPKEKQIFSTDIGTVLKGYEIPSYKSVINIVKELHLRLPYFNLIGWDFGIDKHDNPILIEWNRCPDLSQTAHGPAFGELTEEILSVVRTKINTRFEGSPL